MFKKLAVVFLISGSLMIVKADTVTPITSSAANTTNNSISLGIPNAGPTQDISSYPGWAGPLPGSSWVSFANTGNYTDPGFYIVPNGTAVTFFDTFMLNGNITDASLEVLADDTASVIVNGTMIFAANLGGSYPFCSSLAIGCLPSTAGIFGFAQLQPYLISNGLNTISFTVYQEGGASFGLDYAGSFTTTATPEPNIILLLVCGLASLALTSRHRFAV